MMTTPTASAANVQMSLGEAIRLARRRSGYSQDRIAQAIGVSRPTYGNWERDVTVPDVQEFARLVVVADAPWLWSVIEPRLTLCSKVRTPRAGAGTGPARRSDPAKPGRNRPLAA